MRTKQVLQHVNILIDPTSAWWQKHLAAWDTLHFAHPGVARAGWAQAENCSVLLNYPHPLILNLFLLLPSPGTSWSDGAMKNVRTKSPKLKVHKLENTGNTKAFW